MFDGSPHETKSDMGRSHGFNCKAKPLIDPSSFATLIIIIIIIIELSHLWQFAHTFISSNLFVNIVNLCVHIMAKYYDNKHVAFHILKYIVSCSITF
jgi:hypothetical protein